MRIEEIVWLQEIVEKLALKHGVQVDEVEQAFNNRPRFRYVEKGRRTGEDVYLASGQTNGGRYLATLFIYKSSGEALILSARDMTGMERKRYERK